MDVDADVEVVVFCQFAFLKNICFFDSLVFMAIPFNWWLLLVVK